MIYSLGAGEPSNSLAVTPSAASVKCTCISGFRSAKAAGFPLTLTAVAVVTLYVLASVDMEFFGSTVMVIAAGSTDTMAMYTIFFGRVGFGAAASGVTVPNRRRIQGMTSRPGRESNGFIPRNGAYAMPHRSGRGCRPRLTQ